MRCPKAREYLSHQLDEQLTPDRARALDAHLDRCEDCRDYRADLALGRRLLAATDPELPSNFEWKLQLRLNQALQQAAGDVAYPWQEERPDRWRWFGNFGAAAAVGLAAVLAVAVFLGPLEKTGSGRRIGETRLAGETSVPTASDRLPLGIREPVRGGGLYSQGLVHNVSGGGQIYGGSSYQPTWSSGSFQDGQTIFLQRKQIHQLQQQLQMYRIENRRLQAELDTVRSRALDTGQDD